MGIHQEGIMKWHVLYNYGEGAKEPLKYNSFSVTGANFEEALKNALDRHPNMLRMLVSITRH